jgi:hypothetical protein
MANLIPDVKTDAGIPERGIHSAACACLVDLPAHFGVRLMPMPVQIAAAIVRVVSSDALLILLLSRPTAATIPSMPSLARLIA